MQSIVATGAFKYKVGRKTHAVVVDVGGFGHVCCHGFVRQAGRGTPGVIGSGCLVSWRAVRDPLAHMGPDTQAGRAADYLAAWCAWCVFFIYRKNQITN